MILTVHGSDNKLKNASNVINEYWRDRQKERQTDARTC